MKLILGRQPIVKCLLYLSMCVAALTQARCAPTNMSGQLTVAEKARIQEALSLETISEMVHEGETVGTILGLARKQCISFAVTNDVARQLHQIGAERDLVSGLKTVCVASDTKLSRRGGEFKSQQAYLLYGLGLLMGAIIVVILVAR